MGEQGVTLPGDRFQRKMGTLHLRITGIMGPHYNCKMGVWGPPKHRENGDPMETPLIRGERLSQVCISQ